VSAGRPRDQEAGFTLVEVLVAFFIAALTLTAALRVLGEGTASARRGPEAAARLEEATSLVETLLAAPRLAPGERDGLFADGRRWRVRVTDVTGLVAAKATGRLLRLDLFSEADGAAPLLSTAAVVAGSAQ
jgi:general secretion pathway protein I